MKAPREIRRWVAKMRARRGKRNGVVSFLWDAPIMERKLANNKRHPARSAVEG